MIFSSILFVWLCFLYVDIRDCFTLIIELTLFLILAHSLLSRYAFYHHTFQNFMNMHAIALFGVILDCLDIYLIV